MFFVRTVVPEDDAPAPAVDVVADEEDGPLVWLMVEGEREMKKGGNKEWDCECENVNKNKILLKEPLTIHKV